MLCNTLCTQNHCPQTYVQKISLMSSAPCSVFVHLMELELLLQQVKDFIRAHGTAPWKTNKPKNYFTHFCPLQSHNKIHPYCLAFTYRALWVSLSLVCTTERVNVRLQRTGLSKKIYITFLWRLSAGKETAEGYGLAERTRDPWSIQSVRHHNASARYSSPCYRPRAQTTIWRGFSSLPKHCKVNTSGVGSWI